MSEQIYLVTWSIIQPRNEDWHRTIDDHFAALDDLNDAKELYGLLYLHNENQTTELRLIGQRFSYGTLKPGQEVRSLTLSVPMIAETYPCVDAVIWNRSKGEGQPPCDLRFEELNAANGTHIFVHNEREGQ